jgi:hypothetical protein
MDDLIRALTIFLKYANVRWPTHCEHDELWIMGVDRADVSDEDHALLDVLGFQWDEADDSYKSFRFGSA